MEEDTLHWPSELNTEAETGAPASLHQTPGKPALSHPSRHLPKATAVLKSSICLRDAEMSPLRPTPPGCPGHRGQRSQTISRALGPSAKTPPSPACLQLNKQQDETSVLGNTTLWPRFPGGSPVSCPPGGPWHAQSKCGSVCTFGRLFV